MSVIWDWYPEALTPQQEILDQARSIAAELSTHGIDNNVNRLLAKAKATG